MEASRRAMPQGTLYVEREPPVARIVFDRPDTHNPMSEEWRLDMEAALNLLRNDGDISVVIVKANGTGLSAGGDLNFVVDNFVGSDAHHDRETCLRLGRFVYRVLWQFPKPIILQVHGFCLGGAIQLMGTADIVIVADDARIGIPEARTLGFDSTMGFWALNIGARWTRLLLYTGDLIDGHTAQDIGMVTKAVPADELERYVEWIAHRVATVGSEVLAIQKEAVNKMFEIAGLQTMMETTVVYNHLAHGTKRAKEWRSHLVNDGLRAAIDWRDAPYGGRVKRGDPLPLLAGPPPGWVSKQSSPGAASGRAKSSVRSDRRAPRPAQRPGPESRRK
jgi:enoyl-CoA hydratase